MIAITGCVVWIKLINWLHTTGLIFVVDERGCHCSFTALTWCESTPTSSAISLVGKAQGVAVQQSIRNTQKSLSKPWLPKVKHMKYDRHVVVCWENEMPSQNLPRKEPAQALRTQHFLTTDCLETQEIMWELMLLVKGHAECVAICMPKPNWEGRHHCHKSDDWQDGALPAGITSAMNTLMNTTAEDNLLPSLLAALVWSVRTISPCKQKWSLCLVD